MRELEYTDCPVCDSKDYEKLFTGKDFLFSQKEFTVVRCESCKVIFTNPRIKEDQISHYYFADYEPYKELRQHVIVQKAKNIFGQVFGNPHWEILKELQSHEVRSVLEIGPGSGKLLFFLKKHGFDVVGVEIDGDCVNRIRERGIHCCQGDLDKVMDEIGSKKFDAVVLYHVFEHIYHPKETLRNIYNLLNDNGIIHLSIPNINSVEARLFGKYWTGIDLPRHIVHYSKNSIKQILIEAHFEVIKLENEFFTSFLESLGFFLFKKRMPSKSYFLLYYPWKFSKHIHMKIIGSGIMKIIAKKV